MESSEVCEKYEQKTSNGICLKFWKSALIYRITPSAIPFFERISFDSAHYNVYYSHNCHHKKQKFYLQAEH